MDQQELVNFAAYGIDRMIADLEKKRTDIRQMQQAAAIEVKHKRGRPPQALLAAVNGATTKSGWPADPEERKAEMRRRIAKRNKKNAAQTRWKNSTPAQREKWQKKMQAGNRRKRREQRAQQGADNARRAVEQHRQQQPMSKLEATA